MRWARILTFLMVLSVGAYGAEGQAKGLGSISGMVVDESGAAIEGARITVVLEGGARATTVTRSDGSFAIGGLSFGHYRVQVDRNSFESSQGFTEVTEAVPNSSVELTLRVRTLAQEVKVEAESSYVSDNSSTATKTDTPLMETPMTVQIMPQQILRELGITSSGLSNALAQEGVQTRGYAPDTEIQIYRGFETTTTLWNGFRIEEAFAVGEGNGGVWMDNVDRLEVLKGPSSILYGRAEPGGAVNVLTRKPQPDFHASLRTGVGSWLDRWLAGDVTGTLNRRKTLLYRLNFGLEGAESYLRLAPDYSSRGIAPALAWRITPRTTLSFEGQYRSLSGMNGVSKIPIDPSTGQPIPVSRSLTYPRDTISKFSQYRTMIGLDHRFNADWSVLWKILHDYVNSPLVQYIFYTQPSFPVQPSGVLPIRRNPFVTVADTKVDAMTLDLTGHVTTLGIKHTFLMGAEYYNYRYQGAQGYDFSASPAFETDYFNPALFPWDSIPLTDTLDVRRRSPAFYLQDQIALKGNWHLLLGMRYQHINEYVNFTGDKDYASNVVLPRVGLLWRPKPWISPYYSYAENMGVTNGFEFPDKPLAPERSRQHELGVKTQWLQDRVIATLAVFDLTKFNIAAADPVNPGFNIGVGKVESTGFEFTVQGAITNNWNVLLNYSRARPEVEIGADSANAADGKNIEAGQLLPYVSNCTFSSLTSLDLPWKSLRGWTVGGGVNWASATNPYPSSTLPTGPYTGYTVASAFTSYQFRLERFDASLQLNVNNLFDEKYLLNLSDNGRVASGNYGAPRQFRLSLRVGF